MRDEELRDQLAAWIRPVESVPAPDISVIRRRARRRAIRKVAAGIASVAVAGAVASAVVANLPSSGRPLTTVTPSAHPAWYPAGPLPAADAGPEVAPYFVTLAFQRSPVPAVVTNAFSGKVIATVQPVHGTSFTGGIAAAGDDRTFVLAAQHAPNGPGATFYELRLGPTGRPKPLTVLPVPHMAYAGFFAVSADGSKLAIATGKAGHGQIEVISLATGAVRVWGSSDHGDVTSLSWAGDLLLAFGWSDASHQAQAARQRSGLRLLDTAAPGGDLMSSSRVIISQSASTGFANPLITADGSKVFATVVSGGPPNPTAEVVEFSVGTGQAVGAVMPSQGESGTGRWCGALWADPSGEHLIAACGIQGRIDNGHFTQMNLHVPIYNFSTPRESFIAW